jgi:hypothetical protein
MFVQHAQIDEELAWGLGWGIEIGEKKAVWHWGNDPGYKNFVIGWPVQGVGLVVFTNGDRGAEVYTAVVRELLPGPHPSLEASLDRAGSEDGRRADHEGAIWLPPSRRARCVRTPNCAPERAVDRSGAGITQLRLRAHFRGRTSRLEEEAALTGPREGRVLRWGVCSPSIGNASYGDPRPWRRSPSWRQQSSLPRLSLTAARRERRKPQRRQCRVRPPRQDLPSPSRRPPQRTRRRRRPLRRPAAPRGGA